MSTKAEEAVAIFKSGFNCSQAALSVYAEECGITPEIAHGIAGPFGGGMSMGNVCGAVTGAFMAIGLKYPRLDPTDAQAREKNVQLVRELAKRFIEKHGSIECKCLLGGVDLGTADGARQAREQGLFQSVCPQMVHDAVEILEGLLADNPTN
jgi:C_GCAxxG_C_C family probable redox protein